MSKFDHSKAAWKSHRNTIPGMSDRPKREYQKASDPAGMKPERRRWINQIKDDKLYPDQTKEVWE
jgi:hypothetical protein